MFRKLGLAAAMVLGMGAGLAGMPSAQAAVAHPAANSGVIQAIEQSAPAPNAAQPVYHYGRPHYRPHYRPHWRPRPQRYCRWQRVRVHTYHGWRWVNRRVCWR